MTKEKQILVIDDEQDLLDILCALAEEEGVEALGATDAEQGLRLFEDHKPGVVVTDFYLPGRSGADVLAAIKAADPRTKVVIMSGDPGACPSGADATLPKPIDFDLYAELLQKLV